MQSLSLKSFQAAVETSKTNYAGFVKLSSDGNSVKKIGCSFFARVFGWFSKPTAEENMKVRQSLYESIKNAGACQESTLAQIKESLGLDPEMADQQPPNLASQPLSRKDLKAIMNFVANSAKTAALGTDDVNTFMETDVVQTITAHNKDNPQVANDIKNAFNNAKTLGQAKELQQQIKQQYFGALVSNGMKELENTPSTTVSRRTCLEKLFSDALPDDAPVSQMNISDDMRENLIKWQRQCESPTGKSQQMSIVNAHANGPATKAALMDIATNCPFVSNDKQLALILKEAPGSTQFFGLLNSTGNVDMKQFLGALNDLQAGISKTVSLLARSAANSGVSLGDTAKKELTGAIFGLYKAMHTDAAGKAGQPTTPNADVLQNAKLLNASMHKLLVPRPPVPAGTIVNTVSLLIGENDLKEGHPIANKLKTTANILDNIVPDSHASGVSDKAAMPEEMLQFFNQAWGVGIQRPGDGKEFKQLASNAFNQDFLNVLNKRMKAALKHPIATDEKPSVDTLVDMAKDFKRNSTGYNISINGKTARTGANEKPAATTDEKIIRQNLADVFAADTKNGGRAAQIIGCFAHQAVIIEMLGAHNLLGEPSPIPPNRGGEVYSNINISMDKDGNYNVSFNAKHTQTGTLSDVYMRFGDNSYMEYTGNIKVSFDEKGEPSISLPKGIEIKGKYTPFELTTPEDISFLPGTLGFDAAETENLKETLFTQLNSQDLDTFKSLLDAHNNAVDQPLIDSTQKQLQDFVMSRVVTQAQRNKLEKLGIPQSLQTALLQGLGDTKFDRQLVDKLLGSNQADKLQALNTINGMLARMKANNCIEPLIQIDAKALEQI